jgi:uncharacterized protein YjlB
MGVVQPARRSLMFARETLKRTFERVTGVGRPSAGFAHGVVRTRKPQLFLFADDGTIPNNPKLPFICYRSVVRLSHFLDPAAVFEELFARNSWRESWRNGIYDYVHYHSGTHEVLGVARGHARVKFGGKRGKILSLKTEDVAILPAGTGHQCLWAGDDLLIVGAYAAGGTYDQCDGAAEERASALKSISEVAVPSKDPIYGTHGPLSSLWRR